MLWPPPAGPALRHRLPVPAGTGILDNTPQNLIYILAYPFLMLLFAISLVLMATDRDALGVRAPGQP